MKFIVIALMLITTAAEAAPLVCMTKAEAKARWPKGWLYWHTKDKCWSNSPNKHKKFYWVVVPLNKKDPIR